ncbi:hypothetical protein BJV82DRAFT_307961 [Fennellomyces sp. T-0311]|nr:hypothetical protein BJV82DRAFT_307961 [Fennellomyces sp. T-0311]
MLAPGERITFEYANREGTLYHCPYKGCTKRTARKCNLYKHLRTMHDKELPKLTLNGFFESSDEGWGINFDENCRDLLNPEDKLKPMEHPKRPDTKYCPYQSCNVSTTTSGDLHRHIRKFHDHEYPVLPRKRLVLMNPTGSRIRLDGMSLSDVESKGCV